MAQMLVPSADTAVGSWTPTPLFSKVDDDSTANPTGDGVLITSDSVGNNSQTTTADLGSLILAGGGSPATPDAGTVTIRARWRHDVAGRSLRATAELWEGIPGVGTLIASLIVDPDVGSTEVTSTYDLTTVERDAIADWTDLHFRLYGFGTGGGPSRALEVDLIEVQTPDSSPTSQNKVVNEVIETEAAQVIAPLSSSPQTIPVLTAIEIETETRLYASLESEAAGTVTATLGGGAQSIPVGASNESEAADTISILTTVSITVISVSETEAVEVLSLALGLPVISESEEARVVDVQAGSAPQSAQVVAASELEASQVVATATQIAVAVNAVTESDLTTTIGISLGLPSALESEQAQPVGSSQVVSLFATGTQTIADVVDEENTTIDLHLSVDDDPASPDDADWVNNTDALNPHVFFDLTDLPVDFGNAEAATVAVRARGQDLSSTMRLYAQLFQSDEITPMSDEVETVAISVDDSFTNYSVSLLGLDDSSPKSVWDAARIRFRWEGSGQTISVASASESEAAVAISADQGEEFTPDTIILTTDNPQTVIDANPNDGHVFEFEAGTHSISALLTPSADNQVFQGETDGTPVTTTPLDPDGGSLGMTKTLWSAGTPTSIVDGGGSASGFMLDDDTPVTWTGIRVRRLKLQGFVDVAPIGIVGGRYTDQWIVEECWLAGSGGGAVRCGNSMIIRRNKIHDFDHWVHGFNVTGTLANPTIIEDNEVFDINLGEAANVGNDSVFKIIHNEITATHFRVRRNYVRNTHGPAIWFDRGSDDVEIHDNITVDCGQNNTGLGLAHIFYEANDSHSGAEIFHNWCLGWGGRIFISYCHGSSGNWIHVWENTADCDDGSSQGIQIKDSNDRQHVNNDSTISPPHPVINNNSLGDSFAFADWIRIEDNVIRKRNSSINNDIPLGGSQINEAGGADLQRNYEWLRNKYEVNSAISTPYKWNGYKTFAQWQAQRAAQNDTEGTGPFFDADGDFVTWSGTKQFADTTCNWEGA